MTRKRITHRTAERLIKAAYEYEYLASVMRREGLESHADRVKDISSALGDAGRRLSNELTR